MDMNAIVEKVVLTKVCSISPDKDSNEHKSITLNIKFDGVTLGAVFAKAVSSAVIQWQNGPGRSKFEQWPAGGKVDIDFKAPGATAQVDPETAMVAKLQSMATDEERAEYIKNVLLKKGN